MSEVGAREKILKSALALMHARGFNGCSILEITEAAGIPNGSFYNHFPSKEQLAIDVLSEYMAAGEIERLFDVTKSPLERVRSHFRFLADAQEANGWRFGCVAGNFGSEMSDSSPVLRAEVGRRFKQWTDALSSVVADAQAAGEVAPDKDANQMARFMISAWEGAILLMKTNRSNGPIDDFFEIAFGVLEEPANTTASSKEKAGSSRTRKLPA